MGRRWPDPSSQHPIYDSVSVLFCRRQIGSQHVWAYSPFWQPAYANKFLSLSLSTIKHFYIKNHLYIVFPNSRHGAVICIKNEANLVLERLSKRYFTDSLIASSKLGRVAVCELGKAQQTRFSSVTRAAPVHTVQRPITRTGNHSHYSQTHTHWQLLSVSQLSARWPLFSVILCLSVTLLKTHFFNSLLL